MSDPTRWRDELGAHDERRALLLAHQTAAPSKQQADAIWSGLQSRLQLAPDAPSLPVDPGAGAAAATAAAAAGATAGAGALAAKVTLTVALVAAVGTGVGVHRMRARERLRAPRPTIASAVPAAATVPAPAVVAAAIPVPAPAVAVQPAPPATDPSPLRAQAPGFGERASRRRPGPGVTTPAIAPMAAPTTASAPGSIAAVGAGHGPADAAGPARGPTAGAALVGAGMPSPLAGSSRDFQTPSSPIAVQPASSSSGQTAVRLPPPMAAPAPPPAEVVPVNLLLEEGRRLDRARTALRANDPDRALRWLAGGSNRVLTQEREALIIEAMSAKPALRTAAVARAGAFLRAYPQSPYRAHIRAIAVDSP